MTIFGSGLGPQQPVSFQLKDGKLPTELAGTRVLVEGQPIPILYSSYWQINAVLPYSIPGYFRLAVEYKGLQGEWKAPAHRVSTDLSIFTFDGSGSGRAIALNQDGTPNSAANPAKAGSVITLYGTGGGATNPAGRAGEITALELRTLISPFALSLEPGDTPLTPDFAGAAPAQISGVDQINLHLPDPLPELQNKSAVTLRVNTSQTVTIAVR